MFRSVFALVVVSFGCSALSIETAYSIVFIHIGKTIPPYASIALEQARTFNPEADIVLLANQDAISARACQKEFRCVALESLAKRAGHEEFLRRSGLDSKSREGFWLYASERFLYLADFMEQHQVHNVFHLEYDNMLYADLGTLLPIFRRHYSGIAATFDNDERCIPGFMYIRSPEAMTRLAQAFGQHAHENLNDMQLIALFKKENPNDVHSLPIITAEYIAEYTLVSPSGHIASDKTEFSAHVQEFKSIFDAAALGQFLGGIDPRNGDSSPGFINESCVFDPSKLDIQWHYDEQGRRSPHVVYSHAKYRINNLHIHSKNLSRFKSKSEHSCALPSE